jgi:hypothetical protein
MIHQKHFTIRGEWARPLLHKRNHLSLKIAGSLSKSASINLLGSVSEIHCSLFFLQATILCFCLSNNVINIVLISNFCTTNPLSLSDNYTLYSMLWHLLQDFTITPSLVSSINPTEKAYIDLTDLDEVFAGCDSVLLLLICESVWNKLNADLLFYKCSWRVGHIFSQLICCWT